ncbi:Hermansky-Pudlak syndrome 6 protein -like protein [Triplophysa tibetana]|uniref:Hermansky-Pudlak syndrome 6 protein-like protein n=1 Tax=Triplophysa tibetana TaxID=1572043 RepID=A0A5A9P8M6_9TELE|nr:Hermansky-Pudlak syndrome 6 protein -like protein [Triplophysa tibetana]
MTRLELEQVTDFGDFTKGNDLKEFLKQTVSNCLSDVRLSPDGRHIHVIVRQPRSGLMTYDKNQRPHLVQCQKNADLTVTCNVPIVDVIYMTQSKAEDGSCVLGIIFENGKAEFWKFLECRPGWHLLQTVELCNSPTARVVSVCICLNFIVWCEERPPSESSGGACNNFRYCICMRTVEVNEGGVSLGCVKIALHHNPRYTTIASGDLVYLLPVSDNSPVNVFKVFLAWSPEHNTFKVHSTCSSSLLMKSSKKESDFTRLVTDCVGILSTINPPDICGVSPAGYGDLLLLLSTGWVCVIKRDGGLWKIYKLPDNCLSSGDTQNSLNVYKEILALTVKRTLFLIDTKCGQELERISLKWEGRLLVNTLDTQSPQMLSETGLFKITQKELDAKARSIPVDSSTLLVEAVFEEACKYYQQRSLSSTQLTVEKLKKGGMFQAPISLAAILGDYLNNQNSKTSEKKSSGQERLMNSLESELKSLVSLEDIKTSMLMASEKDLESDCENLVQQEICRLLSAELDKENLHYLNSIFHLFPAESWHAMQAALQLRGNGEGSLSSKASAELWKIILSPVQPTANFAHCNGQQKHTNAVLPVFELLCHSIFKFQPDWLPRFLELALQQVGASSTSSWNFGGKESSESIPLYKRALAVLPCKGAHQHLEVELLLCSQRPNAIMQALRILIELGQWERVTQVAERFCRQSPLLNKEIFSALLCEVSQHRDLDPYLDLLWTLCPDDMSVTSILNMVLKNLPTSTQSSGPFEAEGSHITIGLLKPLLRKVLQRETKPSHGYADILQSPTCPPPTPPRQAKGVGAEPDRALPETQMTSQAGML